MSKVHEGIVGAIPCGRPLFRYAQQENHCFGYFVVYCI